MHLLLTEVFPPQVGGSGRFLWEVYRRLPSERVLVAAHTYPGHEAADRDYPLPVYRLPLALPSWGVCDFRGGRAFWSTLRQLRQLVRREGVTHIHSGKCLPEGLLAFALRHWKGMTYTCHVWGEELGVAHTSRELTWLTRRVLHGAKHVVACSTNSGQLLLEDWHLPAERLSVINPGVDLDCFTPAAPDPAARQRLGWQGRTVLLTVSRLDKRKGHDMLLRALPAIRQAVPDVLYAIVGHGTEWESLHRQVAEQGLGDWVQFLGQFAANDPPLLAACYQHCDLFVHPNRQVGNDFEGFGMVLLEAQACGKPVLAGASGGTADTLRDGETGRLVRCEEPGPLAAAVIDLLSDRARLREMGKAARHWVVERFDWSVVSTQMADALQLAAPAADRLAPAPLVVGERDNEHQSGTADAVPSSTR
jgi:phosphatidylinositol alpha-1,6-mannosyltransferase